MYVHINLADSLSATSFDINLHFSDYKNLFVLTEPFFFEFGLISESYCIEASNTKEWPEKSYGEKYSV